MPGLRAEGPRLRFLTLERTVAAAAGAALAALAGLLGRWSANPALGWAVALGAAGLGRAALSALAGSSIAAPEESPTEDSSERDARSWAVAGSLAALAVPALLRAHGLSGAAPSLLYDPLDGGALALVQAGILAAFAAGAWSRASRGAGAGGTAAALAAGAAVFGAMRFADPAMFLAAAALAVLAAAELRERPWRSRETAPLRARAYAMAAVLGLALAALAPNLLPTIWMARLQSAYPGGSYLTLADDGARLWAAYRFSNGDAMMLRDGVPQTPDPATARLALFAVLGQRPGLNRILLARPPEALLAIAAQEDGALVTIEDGSRAEAAVLDALGGRGWRDRLIVPREAAAPNAALIFLPTPSSTRGLADLKSLKALRRRLADGAAAGVLFPAGAPARDVDAAARDAAAVFGAARVADLPKGVLVLASPAVQTDPAALTGNLTPNLGQPFPELGQLLAARALWRSAPSAK